ncbi:MAG: glycosyltransferase family 87 protein [Planctomycetota bacterium]
MHSPRSRTRLILLFVCVLIYAGTVLAVGAYRARTDQSSTSDFDDFYLTAKHFRQTGQLVDTYGVHNYLPFFVLLMTPFSFLPITVASVVFNGLSLGGFLLSVRLIDGWMISGDTEARGPPVWLRIGATVGMVLVYVTGCLVIGQMALFTLTMLVFVWQSVETRHPGAGGFWLALAISTKVYPAVLILFFLLKRQWLLVFSTAAWLVVMNAILPTAALGVGASRQAYVEFWHQSVLGQSSQRLAVIDSNKMSYTNQSAAIVARRLTHPTDSGVDQPDGSPRFINVVNWDATPVGIGPLRMAPVQWLLWGFQGLAVLCAVGVCRHGMRRISMARARHEFAAFVVLSLLLSPIVWSFYYSVCYLPLALVNRHGLEQWRGGAPPDGLLGHRRLLVVARGGRRDFVRSDVRRSPVRPRDPLRGTAGIGGSARPTPVSGGWPAPPGWYRVL